LPFKKLIYIIETVQIFSNLFNW